MKNLMGCVLLLAAGTVCGGAIETWRVHELAFEAGKDYAAGGGDAVRLDVAFSNRTTGAVLTRPAFWDGGKTFRVRFAPTAAGVWDWRTTCPDDAALAGKSGSFDCVPYAGPLAIYRHGFVKTVPGKKHFVHADGTPFLYLGDTHWGMYREEIDVPGPNAGQTGAKSHFAYVVKRRAEQGFTVYQSEPIDAKFDLKDGRVDTVDIAGFRLADRYYQTIADAGLVHANAEFFFAASMPKALADDASALARISRYWVARFGAYPVMWTLAQECDNDFYFERHSACNFYDATNNPWVKVAECLHACDAYAHPLSGHQENTGATTITGKGTRADKSQISCDGRSAFADDAVAKRAGHTWWAAQWSPDLVNEMDFVVPREYWASPRPAVNYEGRYCGLWTKDFGARAQGWIAFLTGFCGYGYGAIDMWLYKSSYDVHHDSHDGVEPITKADKLRPWCESIEYPSAKQMGYLRTFLEGFDWWNLKPVLADAAIYTDHPGVPHACAKTADRWVFYFYGKDGRTGLLKGVGGAFASARWFNPRTGETLPEKILMPNARGVVSLPLKPDAQDWVLTVARKTDGITLGAGETAVLDFGPRASAGYATFTVSGAQGGTLRVSYANHPDGLGEKGDFWRETAARYLGPDVDLPILPANIDRYELYPLASNGVYRAKLLQGLVRYARLKFEGGAGRVKIDRFALVNDRVCSEGERQGRFDCSDRQLSTLWEASVRTCELSSIPEYDSVWGPKPVRTLPYVADGAKRDRLVWSGDLWFAERSCYYGFKPSAPYMKGSVLMLAANQTPEGYVQASPWPDQALPKAGEWGPFGSDEFACWLVPVAWDYHLHTGDAETAKKVYPVVQRLMAYLSRYQNAETGIFEQRKETCKHAAGLVFGATSLHHRSYMNILLWRTYVDAAKFADLMGNHADAAKWTAAADRLAHSIRTAFWNAEKGCFALSAEEKGRVGLEANALALATGLVTYDEAASMMRTVRYIGHGKFQQLAARGKCEYGAIDDGIAALDAHNWRKICDPGWEGVQLVSECMGLIRRGWGDEAHPDTALAGLLTNYILGLRPVTPGYDLFAYRIPDSRRISWSSGQVPTPHGEIGASWLRGKNGLEVYINVPMGTRCRIEAPGREPIVVGPGVFRKTL